MHTIRLMHQQPVTLGAATTTPASTDHLCVVNLVDRLSRYSSQHASTTAVM